MTGVEVTVDRPKLRLVLPPSRRASVVTLFFALALAVGAAVAQVWTHQRAIELGYEISRRAQQRDKLQEQNRRLRIELEILKSPQRIGGIAAEEYGMRPPEPEQVRRLHAPPRAGKRDVVVGARQPRAGAGTRLAGLGGPQ